MKIDEQDSAVLQKLTNNKASKMYLDRTEKAGGINRLVGRKVSLLGK